jgi:nucleotide-binding universal stress UspA family protein
MSVPAARRIVVGVDSSAESAAALRWACREASLRGAEVHAVHAIEAPCHSMASYAVPAHFPGDVDVDVMWQSLLPDPEPGVLVRTEIVEGLPARVLLDRSAGADMLVLGTASDTPDAFGSAGPVIRACLRRAPCAVVVIGAEQDPLPRAEVEAPETAVHVPVTLGAGIAGPRVPASSVQGVPVPAGAVG